MYPHKQPFNLASAKANHGKESRTLAARLKDYAHMMGNPKHNPLAYHKPGSNKK